jgi:hypothetical protein
MEAHFVLTSVSVCKPSVSAVTNGTFFVLSPPHPHPSFVEGANLALLDLDYINTFDNLTSPSTSASNAAASTWIGMSASK